MKHARISPEAETLRSRFIHEFIGEILKEIKRRKYSDETSNILRKITVTKQRKNLMLEPVNMIPSIHSSSKIFKKPAQIKRTPNLAPEQINNFTPPVEGELPPVIPETQGISASSALNQIDIFAMGKIQAYILDPATKSLECPGPDKPLIIHRQGITQPLPLSLGEKEIDAIMREISEKTRIPIIPGIFKAVLGNLIVTAVVSEFVGTRFVIQKA